MATLISFPSGCQPSGHCTKGVHRYWLSIGQRRLLELLLKASRSLPSDNFTIDGNVVAKAWVEKLWPSSHRRAYKYGLLPAPLEAPHLHPHQALIGQADRSAGIRRLPWLALGLIFIIQYLT